MKLFARFTPRLAIVYSTIALTLIVSAALGPRALGAGAIGGLIGGLLVTVVGRYIASPLLARRHYRKYKAIQDEFGVELVEQGVRFTTTNAEGTILWDKIHKWRQNDEFVLIYPMPRLFHIIPKSVATQGLDLQELTNALLQHVGKPT
jgi:hypothetical protein